MREMERDKYNERDGEINTMRDGEINTMREMER
jgi:hypothetical protein